MKRTLIRYRTHPDRADENQKAVEAVFAELDTTKPPGVRYMTLRFPDATFIHIVTSDDGDTSGITSLAAFRAFQAGVRERCIEPPQSTDVTLVGSYRMAGTVHG